MKILQINKLYYPVIGGVEKVTKDIAEELIQDKNFEVEVLCCQSYWSDKKNDLINGINVWRAASIGTISSMPLSFSFPFLLWKKAKSFDLLHFHLPFPLAVLSYFLVRPKALFVVTYHSDIVRQKFVRWLLYPLDYWFLKRAAAILVSNSRIIETSYLLKHFKTKCRVIPFGVSLEKFQKTRVVEQSVKVIHQKYGDKIVLFVGRLVIYKGVEYLIAAMKNTDARLIIIGDGFMLPRLKKQTAALNLGSKITFLNNIGDQTLLNFYWSASLVVLPSISRNEVFGLVLLEAMACQRPVISTELGTATSTVNQDGETGYVVPPRNTDLLAKAVNNILNSSEVASCFSKNAYQRIQDHFGLREMITAIKRIYQDVLR